MFRFSTSTCREWSHEQTIDRLQKFIYPEQWDKIDKRGWRTGRQSGTVFEEMTATLERIMANSKGALDIYGPAWYLQCDLREYFDPVMTDRKNYLDDELTAYTPKSNVLERIDDAYLKESRISDRQLCTLLVKSLSASISRNLKDTYEIVPVSWCEEPAKDIHRLSARFLADFSKKTEPIANRCAFYSKLATLFDKEHDEELLVRLKEHTNSYSVKTAPETLAQVFEEMRALKEVLLEVISKHPKVFLPFDKNEKYPKFAPVIRLFRDGDDTFLFAKDVVEACRIARKNKIHLRTLKESVTLDEIISGFKLETKEKRREGVIYTIPLKKFQEIKKLYKLSIKLVNVEIRRTRHLTVPVVSPYGTQCKPASSVFFELLNIVTVQTQAWQRIKKSQLAALEKSIEDVCQKFMDLKAPRFFMTITTIDALSAELRTSINALINDSPVPFRPLPMLEPRDFLSLPQVLGEVVECCNMNLHYPDIESVCDVVAANYSNPTRKLPYTRLDLTMAHRDCMAMCLYEKMPFLTKFLHQQAYCKRFFQFPCACRHENFMNVKITNLQQNSPLVQGVDEFKITFDHFTTEDVVFTNLVGRKKGGRKYVTNEMAQSFILQRLIHTADAEFRDLLQCHMLPQFQMLSKLSTGARDFYMTCNEVFELSRDINARFKAKIEAAKKNGLPFLTPDDAKSEPDPRYVKRDFNVIMEICADCVECFNWAMRVTGTQTSLHEYFPQRVMFLKLRKVVFIEPEVSVEMCVNGEELMETLKLEMRNMGKMMVSVDDWSEYMRMQEQAQTDAGWLLVPIKEVLSQLTLFPINVTRIHFLPDQNEVFRKTIRDVDQVIEDVERQERRAKEVENKEEEEEEVEEVVDEVTELRRKETEWEKEKEVLKRLIDKAKNEAKEEDEKNQALVRNSKKEVKNAQQLLERKKNEFETLKKKNQLLRESIMKTDELNRKDGELSKKQLEELQKDLENLHFQYGTLSESLQSSTRKNEELEKEVEKKLQMEKEYESLQSEHKALSKSLKRKNEELQKKLDKKTRILKENEQKVVESATLKAQLIQITAERDAYRKQLEETRDSQENSASTTFLETQLQVEKLKNQRIQKQNEALKSDVEALEALLAKPGLLECSKSDKSAVEECGICLNEMKEGVEKYKCKTCSTKWHFTCIEKWIEKKATCPVCNRSLPNPREFPDLN